MTEKDEDSFERLRRAGRQLSGEPSRREITQAEAILLDSVTEPLEPERTPEDLNPPRRD